MNLFPIVLNNCCFALALLCQLIYAPEVKLNLKVDKKKKMQNTSILTYDYLVWSVGNVMCGYHFAWPLTTTFC